MNTSITNNQNNISFNTSNNRNTTNLTEAELSDIYSDSILQILDEPFDLQIDRSKLRQDEEFFGFDNNAGDTWIYPKNFPIRAYQYNISKVALFRNTLVSLPTGLGKTFIAAVVMYNIYRWYPLGKVIFLAPTRPLVAQQIEACYKIMGIPKRDTVELTGKQPKKVRIDLWQKKRVFFATPQTIQSDINSNENFPFKQIRLIVIDEAHKAKGKYAYTEVIQTISNRNRWFRVLALSATPGRHIEDVVEVIRNLMIAHVEIRWENSIDVSPYTFKKNIKTEVVPLDKNLRDIKNDFVLIIDKYVRKLLQYDVLSGSTGSLSRNSLLIQQKRFRERSMYHQHPNHSDIIANFSVTISLFHALDLLERHGIRSFLNFFEDDGNSTGEKYFVAKDSELKMLRSNLIKKYKDILKDETQVALPNGELLAGENICDYGHPKFSILKKCLCDFFTSNGESRAIIFCEYRETVLLVYRMLMNYGPLIRAKLIVGKGSSLGIKAVTEKQQKNVMAKFREGIYNTLIATCVAEEGIDVGEVGLIICFDTSTKNPTRFVQRMGRTGRQRQGSVIMLVTEGSEYDNLKDILANKDKTNQKIVRSGEILKNLYKGSSRLVPPEFDPKCLEVFIKNDVQSTSAKETDSDTSTIQTNKTPVKKKPDNKTKGKIKPVGMRDVREYFQRANLSQNELNVFSSPHAPPQSTSSPIVVVAEPPQIQPKMKTRNRLLKNLVDDQKVLNRATDLNVCKLKSNFNFQSTINDKNMDDEIKVLFLKSNLAYLETKVESINIVAAISTPEVNDDDDDCIVIEPEFQKLKAEIDILKRLFDYPEYFRAAKNYDDFLKSLPKFENTFNLSFINSSYKNEVSDDIAKLRYDLFSKQIGKLLDQTEIENTIMDITNDWEMNFHKSIKKKFASSPAASVGRKRTNLVDETPVASSSRKIVNLGDDTPSTSSNRINSNMVDKTPATSSSRKISTKALNLVDEFLTLNYFKLNNFDEIFESNDPGNSSTRQPRRLLFDTEVQIFDDDDNDDIIFTEIKSPVQQQLSEAEIENEDLEVTVDQILEMFDSLSPEHKVPEKSNFDLGDADHLFCSDDDDLFADCDNDGNVQSEDPEQDDEKTQEYDFENFEKSSDLFDATTIQNEPNTSVQKHVLTVVNPENICQADVLTQINPEIMMNNENLLNMETQMNPELEEINTENLLSQYSTKFMDTQINPKCTAPISPKPSNIFYLKTQKLNENLLNMETQINPECFAGTSYKSPKRSNIFHLQTQKFTEKSPSALFKRNKRNSMKDHNSIIEFSQIPVSNTRNRKRIIDSSSDSDKSSELNFSPMHKPVAAVNPRKRLKRCDFIDDEAACEDDDETENHIEEFTQTQNFGITSLIDDDFSEPDEHNTSVDMHQVYLKSVKSPAGNGKFIIKPKPSINYSRIFSQMPEQDDTYCDKDDSFVVGDEEEPNDTINMTSDDDDDECPLERAERILKERRRKKNRRKKRILVLSDDSSVTVESD